MKILLVHNYYKSNFVGGEDLVFKRELNALKIALGEDNVFSYSVSNENISILKTLRNVFFSRKHNREIEEIIIKNKIDLMHVHNFFPLLSTSIFKVARMRNVKTVHTLHNYRFWCIGENLFLNGKACEKCVHSKFSKYGVINGCFRGSKLMSLVFGSAFFYYHLNGSFDCIDYFFTLTDFQREKIIEYGIKEEKIFNKPNFNINSTLKPKEPKNKTGFVFVGRLESSKGVEILIESWKRLPLDYTLTVIGDGPLRDYVLNNISSNIVYSGKRTNKEVIEKLSDSKYLIQTSLCFETFGLTIIEAFQVGTPVIGFNVGTRKNFIKDEYNGFLINDERDFVSTILKANSFEKYETISDNALTSALSFSQNYLINLQIAHYEKILEKTKSIHLSNLSR